MTESRTSSRRLGGLLRGIARWTLRVLLALSILVMIAYLTRRAWLEAPLRALAETAIGSALDAEVQIGSIGGNWLDTIVLEGVQIRGPDALLTVENGRVEAAISVRAAIDGDWPLLAHGVRVFADSLRLRLPEATSTSETAPERPPSEWIPDFVWQHADRLVPSGVRIEITRCTLASSRSEHSGKLSLAFDPRGPRRRIDLHFAGLTARGAIEADTRELALDLRWIEPGALLDTVLASTPLRAGELVGHLEVGAERPLELELSSHELELGERGPVHVDAALSLVSSGRWQASHITAQLPGGSLEIERLGLDDPRIPPAAAETTILDTILGSLVGELALSIDEASGFADLLPPEALPWLPARATLGGAIDSRRLHIHRGAVDWPDRGVTLRIDAGRIPLQTEPGRRLPKNAELRLVANVAEPQSFEIQDVGTLRLRGELQARVHGSLEAPTIDARLALGAGSFEDYGWRALRGTARVSPDFDVDFDLEVDDVGARTLPIALGPLTGLARGRFVAASQSVAADIDLREAPRDDRSAARARGHVAWRDGSVITEALRLDGPIAADIDLALQIAAKELRADVRSLRGQLAEVGVLVGIELPRARIEGEASVRGDFAAPTGTVTLRAEAPDPLGLLEELTADAPPPPDSPTEPTPRSDARSPLLTQNVGTAPLIVAVDLIRNANGIEITSAKATLGELLTAQLAGPLPFDWNGEALVRRPVAPDGDATPLRGGWNVTASLVQPVAPPIAEQASADQQSAVPDETTRDETVTTPRARPDRLRSSGAFTWTTDDLTIERVDLTAEFGTREQRAEGQVTLRGITGALLGELAFADVDVAGALHAEPFDLASIPPEVHGLQILAGTLQLDAELAGKLAMPFRDASLRLVDGQLKSSGAVPTIDAVQIEIAADAQRIEIRRATGRMGGGDFALRGGARVVDPRPGDALWSGDAVELDFGLRGRDLLVARRTGLKVRADVDLTLTGSLDAANLTGKITATSGALVQRFSLVPDFRARGGAAVAAGGIELLPQIPEPFGSRIAYDVAIETGEPFELSMHVVEAPLRLSARLRGTGASPRLEGGASALTGTVRLPAMTLKIAQALLTFDPDRPRFPRFVGIARGRRLGVDVQAQVEGSIDRLEIELSSTPAMASEDVLVLISTGRLPDDLRERGLESQAALVGTYLAQEIVDFYLGSDSTEQDETLFDRFHFESGREVSRNGVETLTIEFDLRNQFLLQAERDLYEDYNMGVLYRFRF